VHRESSQRVRPRCPHFGLHEGACGGCKMQHLHVGAQVAIKQRVLEDNLWHLGKVKADTMLPAIEGPAWGYRWRARFSVRHVRKKGAVLVGFHERKSRYVADIKECHVVPEARQRPAAAAARADRLHGRHRDLPADRAGLRRRARFA
jgi:23S rRNA (uracil1939-C5)-methyltransferase